ncbi:hypothetical protein MUP05_04430 [Candidatus Bathyarchaeota archaeon]|nr:hypothetical protein [Candidatus Bathyarchaeota archaeon]
MRMWNSRKAFSGSISAVFVVLLFLLVASSLVSFRFAEDGYNSLVNDRAQRDWERYNERLTISTAVRNATGFLDASIQNVGAVTAHLVTLYVSAYDTSSSPKWQLQYSMSIWIGPGNITYNFGQAKAKFTYTPIITPGQAQQPRYAVSLGEGSLTYVIKLVTERGNIATYILPPGAESQFPGVVVVPGSMSINYVNPNIEDDWTRPYVNYQVLHTQLDAKNFYVRAKFINNWNRAITIQQGTILFQVCVSGANQKILGFGGVLFAAPTTWNPGEEVLVVFRCSSYSGWQNYGQLGAAIFVDGRTQVPWTGSSGFTSSKPTSGQEFFSGAVLIDGLLVYQ